MQITFDEIVVAWNIIASVIAIASIIVKLTPTTKDDIILDKIVTFLKIISLNKEQKKIEISVK